MKSSMKIKDNFIKGSFIKVKPADGIIEKKNPSELSDLIGEFPYSLNHVEEAVAAAGRAYRKWKTKSRADRLDAVRKIRAQMVNHASELAAMNARELGRLLWQSKQEMAQTIEVLDVLCEQAAARGEFNNEQPRGITAILGSFTMPVRAPLSLICSALLAGNTVIFKPSARAPAMGMLLAGVIKDASLPPGTVNIIQGPADVGERLAAHPEIDTIVLSGSPLVATKIRRATAAQLYKRLILLAGGKSIAVVWDDADLDLALSEVLYGFLDTAGQVRSALYLVALHKRIADTFTERFKAILNRIQLGDPQASDILLGPLVDGQKLSEFSAGKKLAEQAGAEGLLDSGTVPPGLNGYFVSPSIHRLKGFDPSAGYPSAHLQGPDICLGTIRSVQDIAPLAGRTDGLHGLSVFTRNSEVFEAFLEHARARRYILDAAPSRVFLPLPGSGFGGVGRVSTPVAWAGDPFSASVAIVNRISSNRREYQPGWDSFFWGSGSTDEC